MLHNFSLYLALATVYVLTELFMAYRDGYAFDWQVRRSQRVPDKFLTFWGHGGMHTDFWLINPIIAYLLAVHAPSWPLRGFATIFVAVAFVGAFMLIPLLEDSKRVASSLTRDGLLPIAGAMHYLYYVVSMSVPLSFYLLTKRSDVNMFEVVMITELFAIHWGIGLLQPPQKVHGKIHLPAKILTAGGLVAMIGLAVRLLNFA